MSIMQQRGSEMKHVTKDRLEKELQKGFSHSPQRHGYVYGTYGYSLDAAVSARADKAEKWRRDLLRIMEDLGVERLECARMNFRWDFQRKRLPKTATVYYHEGQAIALRHGTNLNNHLEGIEIFPLKEKGGE